MPRSAADAWGLIESTRFARCDPEQEVTGTFTTTTKLSEKAREVANYLEIKSRRPTARRLPAGQVQHRPPRCGEERIYHLPFDQQYDTTVIEP